jgi:hypothetical protein
MEAGISMRSFSIPVIAVCVLTGAQPALADCDVMKAMLARQGKALEEAWNDPSKLRPWKNAPQLKCTFHVKNNDRTFGCVNDSAEYRTASQLYHNAARIIQECANSIGDNNSNIVKGHNQMMIHNNASGMSSYLRIGQRNTSYMMSTNYEYFYEEKRFVFRFGILYREE